MLPSSVSNSLLEQTQSAKFRSVRPVMRLVDERKYFTLHADRQTGKSTAARWLVDIYNAGDRYRAL